MGQGQTALVDRPSLRPAAAQLLRLVDREEPISVTGKRRESVQHFVLTHVGRNENRADVPIVEHVVGRNHVPASEPTSDEPWHTMRGGSYDIPLVENVTYEWAALPARYRAANIGFRCVKGP